MEGIMKEKMTSGEIAKQAGVSPKALRIYDEKGLLKPVDISEGNYKLYDKSSLIILEKMCKFASKMLIYKNYESKREICYFH